MDFSQIWTQYKTPLFSFIKSKTDSISEAEDILQEVAIKFHLAMSKQAIENPKAWLYQVARNTIVDFYRNAANRPSTNLEELPELLQSETTTPCVCELTGFVIQHYLPKKYSTPLFMSDIEAIPQKEIAATLELSLTATKSRIQRARKLLKEQVEECIAIEYRTDGSIADFKLKSDCQLPQELLREMEKINLLS